MKRTTNIELDRLKQFAAEGYNRTDCGRLLGRTPDWVYYWERALNIEFSTHTYHKSSSKRKRKSEPAIDFDPLTDQQRQQLAAQAKQALARLFEEHHSKPEAPYDNPVLWGRL